MNFKPEKDHRQVVVVKTGLRGRQGGLGDTVRLKGAILKVGSKRKDEYAQWENSKEVGILGESNAL